MSVCTKNALIASSDLAPSAQKHTHTHTHLMTDVGRPCGGSVVCCGRGCIRSDSTGSDARPCGGDTSDTHLR